MTTHSGLVHVRGVVWLANAMREAALGVVPADDVRVTEVTAYCLDVTHL